MTEPINNGTMIFFSMILHLRFTRSVHPPESPRMLAISETKRKASRPAIALTPTVTRNSIPAAAVFGAIIGRASIINF